MHEDRATILLLEVRRASSMIKMTVRTKDVIGANAMRSHFGINGWAIQTWINQDTATRYVDLTKVGVGRYGAGGHFPNGPVAPVSYLCCRIQFTPPR